MEYNVKVSYIRNKCPNNPKWHSKAYCKVCEEYNKSCTGIGKEVLLYDKMVTAPKKNKVIDLIK